MSHVQLTVSADQSSGPSGPRIVVTLALAGLLSGMALAGVYHITKPVIEANEARALRGAVFKVVPGAFAVQRYVLRDNRLAPVAEDELTSEPAIYAAYDEEGRFLAYAIEGAGPGFQDTIRLLYGYDPSQKQIVGLHILESRETPGLGDRIYKDAAFGENFKALAVHPKIVLVKDDRSSNNEVDAITGATISSRAVVNILNSSNGQWLGRLPPPGQAPPRQPPGPRAEDVTEGH